MAGTRNMGTPAAGVLTAVLAVSAAGQAGAITQTGAWNNTTFGSSGPLTIAFETTATTYEVTLDADGFVFGAVDPDPVMASGAVVLGEITIDVDDDPTFGDIDGTISALGLINLTMVDIPNPSIFDMTVTGVITDTTMAGTYVVNFNDPLTRTGQSVEGVDFALGTFDTQVPEPTSLAVLGLATTFAVRRRRG